MFLKTIIRKVLDKTGHKIQKYPSVPYEPVRTFDLAVQLLMALKGESLNFIQIGANDGEYGDPLRRFITKYAWRGLLVEPQPAVFAKLQKNYSDHKERLVFENVAIASGVSSIEMFKLAGEHAPNSEKESMLLLLCRSIRK